MVGYIVPYKEPPISPSTNMEAAFGRLHHSGADAFGARPTVVESIMVDGEVGGSIYGTIYPTISVSKNGAEIKNPSGRTIEQVRIIQVSMRIPMGTDCLGDSMQIHPILLNSNGPPMRPWAP